MAVMLIRRVLGQAMPRLGSMSLALTQTEEGSF